MCVGSEKLKRTVVYKFGVSVDFGGFRVEFCPKCETRLVAKRKKDGKGCYLSCPKCNYRKPAADDACTTKVAAPKPK